MNITKEQIKEWLLSRSTPENEILPLMVDVIHDCVKDLSPKWVSVDNPPSKSCKVWVNENGCFEICEYYICPEYENAVWLDSDGDEIVPDFSFYMIIEKPEPPK